MQAATSYGFDGAYKRIGVNRTSIWTSEPDYRAPRRHRRRASPRRRWTRSSEDTDVDWRPRVPQWPAVGEIVATAVQAALVGQATPAGALDAAQAQVDGVMKQ